MRELRIPNGVKKIENQFNEISDYDVIIIPPSVRVISNSFNNCKSITSVSFETEVSDNYGMGIYDKDSYISHCGVNRIIRSFNKTSISRIDIPYTAQQISDSFSFCEFLKELNFNVLKDPQNHHKGFGINVIEQSFNSIPIRQLEIPATAETISSSFMHCHSLSDLALDTIKVYYKGYGDSIQGIENISQDSFLYSNLSNVIIPPTVKGINRFSYQSSIGKSDFSFNEYKAGTGSYIGNNAQIFSDKSEGAILFIFDDGTVKHELCEYDGKHPIIMQNVFQEKNIDYPFAKTDLRAVYDAGVVATKNGMIVFIIDGTTCNVFLPTNLIEKQSKSLIGLIGLMNERQNDKKNLYFDMHIYYDGNIFEGIRDNQISLRGFIDYLISFGLCSEKDFGYTNNREESVSR